MGTVGSIPCELALLTCLGRVHMKEGLYWYMVSLLRPVCSLGVSRPKASISGKSREMDLFSQLVHLKQLDTYGFYV